MYNTALSGAKAAAASEIAMQAAPIHSQIAAETQLGKQQQAAVTQEFNSVLPYVQSGARETADFNTQMANDSQAIFQQAGLNLNAAQQNQAQQAQQMAQQIGGPVATGTFTNALSPYETAMGQSSAIGQLNTMQMGTIGTDMMGQFAGQVFPSMAVEQHATLRANINDAIQKLEDQLTTLNASKSKLVDAKLPQLLTAQVNYYKDQAAAKNAAQKAYDTWVINKENADTRAAAVRVAAKKLGFDITQGNIKDAQGWAKIGQASTKLQQAGIALKIKASDLTEKQRHDMAIEGIDVNKFIQTRNYQAAQIALGQGRLNAMDTRNMMTFLDGATGGKSSNKPMSIYKRTYLPKNSPLVKQAVAALSPTNFMGKIKMPAGLHMDSKGNWFFTEHVTQTPQAYAESAGASGTPTMDPNVLYAALSSAFPDESPQTILNAIRMKTGLPTWKPGQPANYSTATLNAMSLSDLTDLAVAHGFPQSPKAATKQRLIDFIQTAIGMKTGAAPHTPPKSSAAATTPGVNSFNTGTYPSMAGS
jgi:hypothetical protein